MNQTRLRGLRSEAEITVRDMAKLLSISAASYHAKEKGRTEFTMSEMFKISAILDKDMSEIFLCENFGIAELLEAREVDKRTTG